MYEAILTLSLANKCGSARAYMHAVCAVRCVIADACMGRMNVARLMLPGGMLCVAGWQNGTTGRGLIATNMAARGDLWLSQSAQLVMRAFMCMSRHAEASESFAFADCAKAARSEV